MKKWEILKQKECNYKWHSFDLRYFHKLLKQVNDANLMSLKGEQDAAELGANTDANHTCTKFS